MTEARSGSPAGERDRSARMEFRSRPVFQQQASLSTIELIVVGAFAGVTAKTVTAPMDRVRLIYVTSPSEQYSLLRALRMATGIIAKEGVESLWRGHMATIWRVAPYAGIQFWIFDAAQSSFAGHSAAREWRRPYLTAAAGALAASSATLVTYPLDVLRTNVAVQQGITQVIRSKNYPAIAAEILKHDGLGGLYRGLTPSLLGAVPCTAVSFSIFSALQQQLRSYHCVDTDADVPVAQRLMAGSISAVVAQFLTFPLNVVRRRMQAAATSSVVFDALDTDKSGNLSRSELERYAKMHGLDLDKMMEQMDTDKSGSVDREEFRRYNGALDAMRRIRQAEGIQGLFKGSSLSFIKNPLAVGIAFVLNDVLKRVVHRKHALDEGDQYVSKMHMLDGGKSAHAKLTAIESLVCGGTAGAVAKSLIAPFDRIKILYQTDAKQSFRWRHAWGTARDIYAKEGYRGLWRGHGATLMRVVPYSATTYSVYDPYKARLRRSFPECGDITVRFWAGALSGATATSLTFPLDVFRARMAVRSGDPAYDGYLRAFREIVKTEGAMSLWSGLRPTLLGIVPYAGLAFSLKDTMNSGTVRLRGYKSEHDLKVHERLASGSIAGLFAQSATYPLDVIRRRMQIDPTLYRNEVQVARSIFISEGIPAFFKGLTVNFVKGPMALAVSFAMNDWLRAEVMRSRR
mmetsp:Transcript_25683/g.47023  ORF Transcript_25683/g.47023 Transcript_25683/m.47023 type:complete len:686 (-) Transcript_25683:64-2121(-)